MYYLNSRYYDPNVGRFINGDGNLTSGKGSIETNMFAYCGSNPVNRKDPSGFSWRKLGNENCTRLGNLAVEARIREEVKQLDPMLCATVSGSVESEVISTVIINAVNGGCDTIIGSKIDDLPIRSSRNITGEMGSSLSKTFGEGFGYTKTKKLSGIIKLQKFTKACGIISAATYGLDIYNDYKNYGDDAGEFAIAAGIDTAVLAAGIGAGALLAAISAPAWAPIAAGIAIGIGGSLTAGWIKRKFCD